MARAHSGRLLPFDVVPGIVIDVDEVAEVVEDLALVEEFLRRVVDGVLGVALVEQRHCGLVRRGVADVFGVGFGDFRIAEEVDERLGFRRVLAGFRDDDVVEPEVRAAFRHSIVEIRVAFLRVDAPHGVAGVDNRKRGVAVDHALFDVVAQVGEHERLLLDERSLGGFDIGFIARVDGKAELQQRNADGVADAVVHEDILVIFCIPEDIPAGDGFIHHGGVVKDADRAPHVRHGILVFRVKAQVEEALVDVDEVRDVFLVELVEQILRDQLFNDVIRGEADIVNAVGGFQLYEHLLVCSHGLIIDLDAGFFGELGDEIFIDIVAPVEDVDGHLVAVAAAGTAKRQGKDKGEEHSKFLFHVSESSVCL